MARVYARKSRLSLDIRNQATAFRLKLDRRLADSVDQGQAEGRIRYRGEKRKDSAPSSFLTYKELGISSRQVYQARLIRNAYSDEQINALADEATENGTELYVERVIRAVQAEARRMASSTGPAAHPAVFTSDLYSIFDALLPTEGVVLDPFAGTGGIHQLATDCRRTIGVELEEEWATQHPDTLIGDALDLPFPDGHFDAICTSPTYGNRMADHHDAEDGSIRRSYTHDLGRPLSPTNSGSLQWGDEYRAFHDRAWTEIVRVLRPSGRLILNIKDHVRRGARQPVTAYHVRTLEDLGLRMADIDYVRAPGMRFGENGDRREPLEWVFAFDKVETSI
jgi:SAM-dependent methyltransferase